jgi:hypothetical protein
MTEQINQASEAVETRTPEERFEAILGAEDSTEQPEQTEEQPNDEMEAETSTEDDVEIEDDIEEEVEEDDTEESEEDEPDVEAITHYKVKANGEEKEVTVDELIKSYQLGTDYTKKTQDLAEQRKALEAESVKVSEMVKLGEQYAQRLQQVEQLLMKDNADVDLDDLKENDPIQYAVKVAEQTENMKKLQAVRQEQMRVAQQQKAYQDEQLGKYVQAEAVKMAEIIPEFSDKKKGEQVKSDIRSFGKSIGFTDEELGQVYDSRHVNVLYKAMKYDRLMKNKAGATKKVAEAPKMVKSKAKVQSTTSQTYRNQRKALRETGSSESAQSVFESILNS